MATSVTVDTSQQSRHFFACDKFTSKPRTVNGPKIKYTLTVKCTDQHLNTKRPAKKFSAL